ncbi:S49 family peptidase [Aliishimia ponticola]|uniref:S49 family peptidase n=1 Tax=Aliishimia ponticola TaxID=2499833 RepID=A0A4S4N8P9_9RHOB|nr:S49 family peptidase [Aliishimia ponticola]THH34428.1 S49 family peptidase [Aliishimia ponticola]
MKRWIPFLKADPVVAVVRMSGSIAAGSRGQINDQSLAPVLERAFKRGKPTAVALSINSPGGSPVQSSLIGQRIRRLAEERNIPVYAFVEDVAASGGYWLAAAADQIWADESSIVGSIGVISAGFGAHEFIAKHGVERRVYTAGKSKSTLDPFRPEKPEDVARLKTILDDLHQNFIGHVKARRGDKLDMSQDLFTGEFWLARKAQDLGLIDGIGHLAPRMKEEYGDKVRFRRYEIRRSLFQRFGASIIEGSLDGLEERAAFAQFGL